MFQSSPAGTGCSGRPCGGRRVGPGVVDRADFEHLAQPAAAHQFAGHAVHGHRALLRADLQHAVVAAHGVDQRPALAHVERERLFGVDVLARLAGVNAGQHALKLAGGHDHGVDILAVEQLAIVLIDGPIALRLGLEGLGPRQIAIAQRDDLRRLGQLLQQQRGPAADADRADRDAVVGPRLSRAAKALRETTNGTASAGGQCRSRGPQKLSAISSSGYRGFMFVHGNGLPWIDETSWRYTTSSISTSGDARHGRCGGKIC